MNFTDHILSHYLTRPNDECLSYKQNGQWVSYTWQTFTDKVHQTAHALKNSGIKTGDCVAIFAQNIPEWIILDVAAFSMGVISVPIYATTSLEHVKYILDETETKLVLVGDQSQYDKVLAVYAESDFLKQIIIADPKVKSEFDQAVFFDNWIKDLPNDTLGISVDGDALATIIYTSGTTGEPKGVMLTQNNFMNVFETHQAFLKFDNIENEHSLSFLPLSHVFERSWALMMLYLGAKVYTLKNPKLIANALREVRPTMMCSIPRLYQKIYDGIWDNVQKSGRMKQRLFNWAYNVGKQYVEKQRVQASIPLFLKLKHKLADKIVFNKIKEQMGGRISFLPVGGAALSPEIVNFFDAIGIHLTLGYGLTETTATVSCYPKYNYIYDSVGVPMIGTQCKLGVQNEILVKGKGVMKGYYKKPDETKAVFTEDGWFKTGDAGKIDVQGNIKIVDRIKDLMKTSNGKYITPQPIENLLLKDNFIEQAVIVGDDKPYVTALLVPNFAALKDKAKQLELKFESFEDLVNLDKVKEFYNEKLNQLQKDLAAFEKIKKFTLLPKEFNLDFGELTPTLKIRRKIILKRFSLLIEKMYK